MPVPNLDILSSDGQVYRRSNATRPKSLREKGGCAERGVGTLEAADHNDEVHTEIIMSCMETQ